MEMKSKSKFLFNKHLYDKRLNIHMISDIVKACFNYIKKKPSAIDEMAFISI